MTPKLTWSTNDVPDGSDARYRVCAEACSEGSTGSTVRTGSRSSKARSRHPHRSVAGDREGFDNDVAMRHEGDRHATSSRLSKQPAHLLLGQSPATPARDPSRPQVKPCPKASQAVALARDVVEFPVVGADASSASYLGEVRVDWTNSAIRTRCTCDLEAKSISARRGAHARTTRYGSIRPAGTPSAKRTGLLGSGPRWLVGDAPGSLYRSDA